MHTAAGHTYTITEDTSVFIAHRDDGKFAWWWSDHYNRMVFFAHSPSELKGHCDGDLFGNRAVWANNEVEALALWTAV